MRCAFHALTIILACGAALAADSGPGLPDPKTPQAPQTSQPSVPADKPSEDSRLDGLRKPEDDAPKADPSWWQKLVREAPNCKSFSDGCRTCSATHVCSNIGIACQPKEWACNDVRDDAKPEAGQPDAKPDPKSGDKPGAEPAAKQ